MSTSTAVERFDPFVDEFLSHIAYEKGLSANTVASYRRDLGLWRRYCVSTGVDPAAATADDITRFLKKLRGGDKGTDEKTYRPASVARIIVSIRSLYRFLAAEGTLDSDPTATIGAPARERALPKAISLDEIERLLSQPADDLLGRRDRAILELLYAGGLRISELCGLDVDDVDLEKRSMTIYEGKGQKTRVVPLGRHAARAVAAYLTTTRPELTKRAARSPKGALFLNARGARLTRQGCWKLLKGYAREAGLGDRVSPHTLRHSFATHMLDGRADIRVVQELLGHASLSTTQVYTLVSDSRLTEVYRSAHPRAGRSRKQTTKQ
ncbi:MAG: site-specific tyrosine recombinase XerD [Actinomycetota bacterium]|nr:site-specific tyrosine recombinase XerD [Actinomycetota bacterium]